MVHQKTIDFIKKLVPDQGIEAVIQRAELVENVRRVERTKKPYKMPEISYDRFPDSAEDQWAIF